MKHKYKIQPGDLIIWNKDDPPTQKKVGDSCLVKSIETIYSTEHVMMQSVNGCYNNPFGESYTTIINFYSSGKITIYPSTRHGGKNS